MSRKGYYDEMSRTFEDIHVKRDRIHNEILEMLEERMDIEKQMEALKIEEVEGSRRAAGAAKEKASTERLLRQLEAGGATARAALRKMRLGDVSIEERVSTLRDDFRSSVLEGPQGSSSSVPGQAIDVEDFEIDGPDGVPLACCVFSFVLCWLLLLLLLLL
ncbi:unnamed protein product [Polarella glacialis]|uniref:Uncharacterized protein n=1 Tax=Polarella glacialis TaxID=89957 RepID=A0A813I9F7_POLGL|nr:unnamed protein product [Polarella glacialis]